MKKYIALTLISFTAYNYCFSRESKNEKAGNNKGSIVAKADACAPATATLELSFNNVRTVVETSGSTWNDRVAGAPLYIVPKEGEASAIFAGSLWMGGKDPSGNLKLAGIRFRQVGNDFWPGPISTDGSLISVSPETCVEYDNIYRANRQEVALQFAYQQAVAAGTENEFPFFGVQPDIPESIKKWPGSTDDPGQELYLAPFMLADGTINEGLSYDWEIGGHLPFYDLSGEVDCRTRKVTDVVPLFGDETLWWVMNDIGNIHTESGGDQIGMEIRAQAFAFATNDEVNNMTFYNYVLINKGSLTLDSTYFAQFTDTDLGFAEDDYVGCDVGRGLAYCYNGDNDDSGGDFPTYGEQPPAIGVDFFEGPYQDADGINNAYGIGFNEALNGLGYTNPNDLDPDSVIDNERYGMRKFFYFINQPPIQAQNDPQTAIEYYYYMTGYWKNGSRMTYGGSGYDASGNGVPTDFCFPGTSDPLNWGTNGILPSLVPGGWSELNENNQPQDRRLVQSAGPFTLDPGEFNNITVGVVYARAGTGGSFASAEALFTADDKAQSLFENCFKILNGPDAPDLTVQELDQEIILYLSNNFSSNNKNEEYEEIDAGIPQTNGLTGDLQVINDRKYKFQGYQIYQVKDATISGNDVRDETKAKLVAQCDIEDNDANGFPISQLINYENDENLGLPVPVERVNGENKGIRHSFRFTQDKFSTTNDNSLTNFKKYYYLAIAYGYNNFQEYDFNARTGQARPYLSSRKKAGGGNIAPVEVTPHKTSPESGGSIITSGYGDGVEITRLEGRGNGGISLDLNDASIEKIMSGFPWKADNLTYKTGKGPLDIKVVDPLMVKSGNFQVRFYNTDGSNEVSENTNWLLYNTETPDVVYNSEASIKVANEQIIPELGISVNISQYKYEQDLKKVNANGVSKFINIQPKVLDAFIEYKDPSQLWLSGIPDVDGPNPLNWIRSGLFYETIDLPVDCDPIAFPGDCNFNPGTLQIDPCIFQDFEELDNNENYEGLLGGIISPYRLAKNWECGPGPTNSLEITGLDDQQGSLGDSLTTLGSFDLVFTPDKSKWSRCPVLEMQTSLDVSFGGAKKGEPRKSPSVDKNGIPYGSAGCNNEEAGLNGHLEGMGWFPGYAIDIETGERVNVAFGEDSYLSSENGRDMLWNPTSKILNSVGTFPLFGGQHYVYVFKNKTRQNDNGNNKFPHYDEWKFGYTKLTGDASDKRDVFTAGAWIFAPLLAEGFNFKTPQEGLVPGEVKIKIRLAKPYDRFATTASKGDPAASFPYTPLDERLDESQNNWMPLYQFNTSGVAATLNNLETAKSALDIMNIVPNPYYAYSAYEINKIDNRVKFTNLPQTCSIRIYNMSGTLIRTFTKDNPTTYLDWDLKNTQLIPISGGVYICHVDVPGVGEKILKFFAIKRPSDLDNF
jgi:hypothetical protein